MGLPSIHPLWLRLIHWINAVAVVVLIMSGWRIYNATRFIWYPALTSEGFVMRRWRFPSDWTLGGWLAGAIEWHFAAMWVLFATTIIYVVMSLITKRWTLRFSGISGRGFVSDLRDFVRGKLSHDLSKYNTIQKVAYSTALIDLVVLIWSGLVLWKPVQLRWMSWFTAGYEGARYVHFYAMAFLCAFIVIHVVMAVLVPKSIKAMMWGR